MPTYNPPLRDMQFLMHEVFKVSDEFKALPKHADVDADTINAVLEEAGKFAAEVTFPLNISGDEEGCTLDRATHEVKAPKGFKEAYAQYVEGGWPALSCDPEYGGQGLPFVVNQCLYEMLNSANQAWTMYPGLSHGAYECLHAHGTEEQKKTYLHQAHQRRMDRHHVPDRSPLRHRPRHAAHQGRAAAPMAPTSSPATRSSSAPANTTWPPTSSTSCWPACPTHRRAARASACSSCPSSTSMPTARSAHATRSSAAASSTRWASTATPPAQMQFRRRHRHAGRCAQQGPGRDVRDDERRPPGRGHTSRWA